MIIGCTGNYRKPEYINIINSIYKYISKSSHDIELLVSSDMRAVHSGDYDYTILDFNVLLSKAEIIIAIGGDGTILSTCRRMEGYDTPIFGIHLGGLGFLAQVMVDNIDEAINKIINKQYEVEERNLLEVSINDKEDISTYKCLNDIVIDHGSSGRVLKSKVSIGDKLINIFESDGVIFSTATGSTAYSLSAGGPIIYPTLDTISIVPICPLSLSARPIIISNKDAISVSFVDKYEGLSCTIDGQVRFEMSDKTKINIKLSKSVIKMLRFDSTDYYETLRTRMGWVGKLR